MRRALLPSFSRVRSSALGLVSSAFLWLSSASGARAELPALSWRAPSGCPQAADVQAAITRSVDPRAPSTVRAVRARVESTYDGFSMQLVLETSERAHEKQLSAKLCSTFVELLLLELSFAALPAAPHTPSLPLGGRDEEAAARDVADAREVPVRVRWGMRASGALATTPLPWPAPSVALALGASLPWLRVELAASYGFARRVRYRGLPEVGAEFQSVAGELRGCVVLPVRRVALPLCVGGELGALHGKGFGVERSASAWRPWAALFVAPALHFPVAGRVSGWVELGAAVSVYRPRFGLVNLPTLYWPDLLSARGALGVVLSLD